MADPTTVLPVLDPGNLPQGVLVRSAAGGGVWGLVGGDGASSPAVTGAEAVMSATVLEAPRPVEGQLWPRYGGGGAPGEAATITVNQTATLAAGQPATVTNIGSDTSAVLNFGIPMGGPGQKGDPGPGVASGGVAGQVLQRGTGPDYTTGWVVPFSTGWASASARNAGISAPVEGMLAWLGDVNALTVYQDGGWVTLTDVYTMNPPRMTVNLTTDMTGITTTTTVIFNTMTGVGAGMVPADWSWTPGGSWLFSTPVAGLYQLRLTARWSAAGSAGYRALYLRDESAQTWIAADVLGDTTQAVTQTLVTEKQWAAGQMFSMNVGQGGSALSLTTTYGGTQMHVRRICA